MWSNPAPPYSSAMATPVSPNAAAWRKLSRGNAPVSSITRASGFTSASANSRTVRCSRRCSSLRSRSNMVRRSHAGSGSQRLAHPLVGDAQLLGFEAGLGNGGHEVGVAYPARQHVEVEVPGDAGTRSAPYVHTDVVAVGMVEALENRLQAAREFHHLGERFNIVARELGVMRVRHDHQVSRRVRIAVKDDVVEFSPQNDEQTRVVACRRRFTEDAALSVSRRSEVTIPPRGPQIIHFRD